MPVSRDTDLTMRLKHFNLFEKDHKGRDIPIEPRDPLTAGFQAPGTLSLKNGYHPVGKLGWDDIFDKNEVYCRWCGAKMFFYEETDLEILYGCPTSGCKNDPNMPEWYRMGESHKSMQTKETLLKRDKMSQPFKQTPRKSLVLKDVEGYVILKCRRCTDQFYVPEKKTRNEADKQLAYDVFKFCAACAQTEKPPIMATAPINKNWKPGEWNPANHDYERMQKG